MTIATIRGELRGFCGGSAAWLAAGAAALGRAGVWALPPQATRPAARRSEPIGGAEQLLAEPIEGARALVTIS